MDTLLKVWTFSVIGLCALYIMSVPINAYVNWDLNREDVPRAHFYTTEDYANCGAMRAEAKRLGADHWTCHKPEIPN
jgi:hypothetical protein